jgi:hypothetical protein
LYDHVRNSGKRSKVSPSASFDSTYDSAGDLMSVTVFGIDITFLFESAV